MEKRGHAVVFQLRKGHHAVESVHVRLPDFGVEHQVGHGVVLIPQEISSNVVGSFVLSGLDITLSSL